MLPLVHQEDRHRRVVQDGVQPSARLSELGFRNMSSSDVPRDGQQSLRLAVRSFNRANRNVPPAQIALGRWRLPPKAGCPPCCSVSDGLRYLMPLALGPELGPHFSDQRVKVVDLHNQRPALTHELQMPIECQDLQAVSGACQDLPVQFLTGPERFLSLLSLGDVSGRKWRGRHRPE